MTYMRSAVAAACLACLSLAAHDAEATTTTLIGTSTVSGTLAVTYGPTAADGDEGLGISLSDLVWEFDTPLGAAHHVLHLGGELAATATTFLVSLDLLPLLAIDPDFDVELDLGILAFGPILADPDVTSVLALLSGAIAAGSGGDSAVFDLGFSEDIAAGFSYDVVDGSTLISGKGAASAFVKDTDDGEIADTVQTAIEALIGGPLPVDIALVAPVTASVAFDATLKSYETTPISLPAGALLLPAGLGALAVMRRRRRG